MNEEKIKELEKELEEKKKQLKLNGFDVRYKSDLLQQEQVKCQQTYNEIINKIGSIERELRKLRKEE